MTAILYTLAAIGAVVAFTLLCALIVHLNNFRRIRRQNEAAIGEFLEENGYGEMGP